MKKLLTYITILLSPGYGQFDLYPVTDFFGGGIGYSPMYMMLYSIPGANHLQKVGLKCQRARQARGISEFEPWKRRMAKPEPWKRESERVNAVEQIKTSPNFAGSTLSSVWIILESFWYELGITLGSFWDCVGIILGSFRDHPGIIP